MPKITDSELSRRIKNFDLNNLYFFYGEEHMLMERAVSAIIKKAIGSEPSDFNLQKFDSPKTPVEDIVTAVDALPLFSERKCVVVNNLNVETMSADQFEKLKTLISGEYDYCVLIFYLSSLEINPKKQAKWRSFSSLCEKHGTVVEFAPKERAELIRILCGRAKRRGCILEPANAARLTDLSSSSLLTLCSEVDKLCDYSGGGEITVQMIEQSVSPSIEASSFDLAKAVIKKNYGRAYSILNDLFYQKIKPELILGALSSSFIDLYRACAALSEGKSESDIASDFSYPKSRTFAIKNSLRDTRGIPVSQIRGYIRAISEADINIKSSPTDNKVILEQLIGTMIVADKGGQNV